MSTNVNAYLGGPTSALVPGILAKVQVERPSADVPYLYTGAVCVGLNRLCSPKRTYSAAQFNPQSIDGAELVTVAVDDEDLPRADALAAEKSATRADVISAALNTGLAMLAGLDVAIVGPFTE